VIRGFQDEGWLMTVGEDDPEKMRREWEKRMWERR
jgi:hypothetical protein